MAALRMLAVGWKAPTASEFATLAAEYHQVVDDAKIRRCVHQFNAGWDIFLSGRSPGLIRSNEALRGWKAAREQMTVRDVDYN